MATTTTKVTFEDERGHKAIASVIIDREERTIDLKVAFEPAQKADDRSDMIMLLNMLIKQLQGDDDIELTDVRTVNDDMDEN